MSEEAAASAPSAPAGDSASQEINDQNNDQAKAPETAAEVARKIKLRSKVDGVETEEEFEIAQLEKERQKWLGAEKRFQEAARWRKEKEEFEAKLGSKEGVLEALLSKYSPQQVREMAEEVLAEHLQFEMMTPEQKRIFELEQSLRQKEQAEKQREQEIMTAKEKAAHDHLVKQLNQEVIEALKSTPLPPNPRSVAEMARMMRLHAERGIPLETKEAAQKVIQEMQGNLKHIAASMDGKALTDWLGPEAVKKVLEQSLTQVKDPVQRIPKEGNGAFKPPAPPKRTYRTQSEFEAHMQKFRGDR